MGKRKDSLALFEVISSSSTKGPKKADLQVPSWMDAQPTVKEEERPVEPQPQSQPESDAPAPKHKAAKLGQGRLLFSLSYAQCGTIAAGALLALIAAFSLGRAGSGKAMTDQAEAAAGAEAAADQAQEQSSPAAEQPAPEATARTAGKYYLIIQGLQGTSSEHLKDAQDIVKFCSDNGESAEVRLYTGNPRQYIVWSLRPFGSRGDSTAIGFAAKIEELGKKYRAAGGRYDFKQRSRDGQLEPWFHPYNP